MRLNQVSAQDDSFYLPQKKINLFWKRYYEKDDSDDDKNEDEDKDEDEDEKAAYLLI